MDGHTHKLMANIDNVPDRYGYDHGGTSQQQHSFWSLKAKRETKRRNGWTQCSAHRSMFDVWMAIATAAAALANAMPQEYDHHDDLHDDPKVTMINVFWVVAQGCSGWW